MKAHLVRHDIKVLEVKQVSHEQAPFKSFKIVVEKQEDYNKLISGECVPQYVRVKRYIPPRSERVDNRNRGFFRGWEGEGASTNDAATRQQDESVKFQKQIKELSEALEAASSAGSSNDADSMDIRPAGDPVSRTVAQISAVTAASSLINTDTLSRDSTPAK